MSGSAFSGGASSSTSRKRKTPDVDTVLRSFEAELQHYHLRCVRAQEICQELNIDFSRKYAHLSASWERKGRELRDDYARTERDIFASVRKGLTRAFYNFMRDKLLLLGPPDAYREWSALSAQERLQYINEAFGLSNDTGVTASGGMATAPEERLVDKVVENIETNADKLIQSVTSDLGVSLQQQS